MRTIEVQSWKSKAKSGDEVDEDTLMMLTHLLNNRAPERMPRGLDQFRLYNRLTKAFDRAKESKTLVLEEMDYKFLKDIVVQDVPASWGANEHIMAAIENFMQTKED